MSTPEYFEKCNNLVSVIKQYSGRIAYHPLLINKWISADLVETAKGATHDKGQGNKEKRAEANANSAEDLGAILKAR
eukprot:4024764-Ditylum_brightwellii.AAC.2